MAMRRFTLDESELLKKLREICLGLPEVRETVKWGHPTFEAGKKMFAVLDRYEDQACIAFRASPDKRQVLLAKKLFFEPPYGGRQGWICLPADGPIEWVKVERLLRDSYRLVALKRMLAALDELGGTPQSTAEQRPNRRTRRGQS
jgi:predicted DNA-binding protein (MmcQ/YjbR family)